MIEEFRKKIILIIEEIINIENPTLEDRKSVIIDKRKLTKAGLGIKEIDNIIDYLKEKGLVESDSALSRFNEAGLLDDVIKTKDSPKNFNKRYDFVKNTYIALVPDFEKLGEYKNKLLSPSVEEKKDNQVSEKIIAKPSKIISYDSNSKILNFQGVLIDFNNSSKQADLLRTIFKKPKISWTNMDLWDDWKDKEENCPKKTHIFYTAAIEINNKINLKTSVNDFLKPRMKEIKINEKYHSSIKC